jgi:hypothetical protein
MPLLSDLRLDALAAHSIEPLQYLDTLERIRIVGINRERKASPLASLRKLRWLALDYRTGLTSLRELVNLERAELMEASLTNLKAFKGWTRLRSLFLSGRGVRSLEGIAALQSLEELFLGRIGAQDLAPLAGMSRLHHLDVRSPLKGVDLGPLGGIDNLRTLRILLGGSASTGRLQSLDFIARLKRLQELEISGAVIVDGRLDALFSLPELRRVRLLGNYGDQVERLRQDKPDCAVEIISLPPETALQVIQIGELEIRQIAPGFWSIMQDLSDSLGVENNFTADRKLRQAIRQRDASLFSRLEFDPDADFIAIRAASEADIRLAAEIIQLIL